MVDNPGRLSTLVPMSSKVGVATIEVFQPCEVKAFVYATIIDLRGRTLD